MNKVAAVIGIALLTVGLYLLLTYEAPTRGQLENPYGDWSDLRKYGGYGCLGAGVLVLVVGIVRAKGNRHDPDLPPEYRV